MSLDVYLHLKDMKQTPRLDRIFIRDNGQTKAISRVEWDVRSHGREPVTLTHTEDTDEVYSANITHNLGRMAAKAGLYGVLWHPETVFIACAAQLIQPLRIGLEVLQSNPDYFKQFNPANGWGTYEVLCDFTADYLAACEEYPHATVWVSR